MIVTGIAILVIGIILLCMSLASYLNGSEKTYNLVVAGFGCLLMGAVLLDITIIDDSIICSTSIQLYSD